MGKPGYVYIMASGRNATLYLGVTSDLVRRAWQHRNGFGSEFSAEHRCRFLVWYEAHDDLQEARLRASHEEMEARLEVALDRGDQP